MALWVLIAYQALIMLRKMPDQQNYHIVHLLFCLCLQHPGLIFCSLLLEKPDSNSFLSMNEWSKSNTWWLIFSGDKSLFETWYRRFCLTLRHRIVSPENNTLILGAKNILCGYSQSNYHLIHLDDTHMSYLIYFQLRNILKILQIKSHLKHYIFHCKIWQWVSLQFLQVMWAIIW